MSEAQNIYDDPAFFAGYSRLERFGKPFGAGFEHAAFEALLPPVTGMRVLDLGCGAGQLSHWLADHDAASVVGVDLSERMLDLAAREWSHDRVRYVRASIDAVQFDAASVDLVVSSLAFHYVPDFAGLMANIGRWLVPGGSLVFSMENPLYLSRATSKGWLTDEAGNVTGWGIDRYGEEGLRVESWFIDGVQKYHRTVASIVNAVIDGGMVVERMVEPVPSAADIARRPEWADEPKRPISLLMRARKASPAG